MIFIIVSIIFRLTELIHHWNPHHHSNHHHRPCLKLTLFQRGDEAKGSFKWGPATHDQHGLYPAHEPYPGEASHG